MENGKMNLEHLTSAPVAGCHLVGFLFSDAESGLKAMRAVIEAYNKTVDALGPLGDGDAFL